MGEMTGFFLRVRHWQNLLFVAIMLLAQIAMFNSMQSGTVLDFGKGLSPFWRLTCFPRSLQWMAFGNRVISQRHSRAKP